MQSQLTNSITVRGHRAFKYALLLHGCIENLMDCTKLLHNGDQILEDITEEGLGGYYGIS